LAQVLYALQLAPVYTMAFVVMMLRSVVLFGFLNGMQGKDVVLRGSGQPANARLLSEDNARKSCGDGMAVQVRPPWESMDAHVEGAPSVDMCKTCAADLESQGHLMPGWECYSSWWSGSLYLKRSGDVALTPVKPLGSFNIDDVEGAGPLQPGAESLPTALRGVFWLSDQGIQSALITFASNNNADGPWCSHGSLILNRYLIRVSGDKVWSWATEENAGYDLAYGLRLVYDFGFDSTTDPTHATIYPILTALGGFGARLSQQTWMLTFTMTKMSEQEASDLGYPGSIVWERRSYAFGVEITSSRYNMVQVVDEDGKRIEPAWSTFAAYQKSSNAGDQPGEFFYHGA